MNIVLDDAVEEKNGGEKVGLGMVVCYQAIYICSCGRASSVSSLCLTLWFYRLSVATPSSCSRFVSPSTPDFPSILCGF